MEDLIKYIDSRIEENPYEGSWMTDLGERVSVDVGYVYDWWNDCMKPELLRKCKEKQIMNANETKYVLEPRFGGE